MTAQGDPDGLDQPLERTGGQGSKGLFYLGPHRFDRVEVRAVRGQIPHLSAAGATAAIAATLRDKKNFRRVRRGVYKLKTK